MATGRAVIARHFPAAWVAPAALAGLPSKVQSLLQRIGLLEGAPQVSRGPTGLEILARFQTAKDALEAVKTLHGFDLRSAAEKTAANFEAPKDSECFSLRIADEPGGAPAAAPARKRRLRPNGIFLSPLPTNWGESDVMLMATPYGQVQRVKVEALGNGQHGALIDYAKDSAASAAQAGLDGLSLMGARLRCVMQEEPEPKAPMQSFVVFLDELPVTTRSQVEPLLDDREIFLTDIPRALRTEEAAKSWLAAYGEAEVLLLRDLQQKPTGKAYAVFRHHSEALKALQAIRATGADGSQQATWSESERAMRGSRGAYGLDMLRRLAGEGGARLRELRQAAGAGALAMDPPDSRGSGSSGRRVRFVAQCEGPAQAEACWALLSKELVRLHELYANEVKGSLVLRGFPASWSEKGLKFVFAPFGGLASVTLDAEPVKKAVDGEAVSAPSRVAYVKLRQETSLDKAVTNLHNTKVGDGDLVEECFVVCHRWHPRSWSDGSFLVGLYVDQLSLSRRPSEVSPRPEDRELFVRNLPLQDMNRQQLQEYFEGFGEVEELHLLKDPFTGEPISEGYVRFKCHKDAVRCIEALMPTDQAEFDPSDLAGTWSESERILQRKDNCYQFNLLSELVGSNGSHLEQLTEEAKLEGLWLLAEPLQQKDGQAPPTSGRQFQFIGRCSQESQIAVFREMLERSLEEIHTKISDRIDRRRRKASRPAPAPAAPVAETVATVAPAGWTQPSAFWGSWQQPAQPVVSPFDGPPIANQAEPLAPERTEPGEKRRRHHGQDGAVKEKRRRSGSRKKRRRREAEDGEA